MTRSASARMLSYSASTASSRSPVVPLVEFGDQLSLPDGRALSGVDAQQRAGDLESQVYLLGGLHASGELQRPAGAVRFGRIDLYGRRPVVAVPVRGASLQEERGQRGGADKSDSRFHKFRYCSVTNVRGCGNPGKYDSERELSYLFDSCQNVCSGASEEAGFFVILCKMSNL